MSDSGSLNHRERERRGGERDNVVVSTTSKSTAPNAITQQLTPHLIPRTHTKFSVLICFPNPKVNNTKSHYSKTAGGDNFDYVDLEAKSESEREGEATRGENSD